MNLVTEFHLRKTVFKRYILHPNFIKCTFCMGQLNSNNGAIYFSIKQKYPNIIGFMETLGKPLQMKIYVLIFPMDLSNYTFSFKIIFFCCLKILIQENLLKSDNKHVFY